MRRYHSRDPDKLAFGGRVKIILKNGRRVVDEMVVANAHPNGARSFERVDCIRKFPMRADGIISTRKGDRFRETG